jgi:hypothetical protein
MARDQDQGKGKGQGQGQGQVAFLQKHLKTWCFIRFGKRVATGWMTRPAGWNTRFDIQKASITLVFIVLQQKHHKNHIFSYVLGSLEM